MRRVALAVLLLVVAGLAIAAAVFRPDKAVRVATGLVSHTLCSETFVAGLDPDQTFAETVRTMPGIRRLVPWLALPGRPDAPGKSAPRSAAASRCGRSTTTASGCTVALPAPAGPATPLPSPARGHPDGRAGAGGRGGRAGPARTSRARAVVEPASEPLRAALDRAFAEPAGGPRARDQGGGGDARRSRRGGALRAGLRPRHARCSRWSMTKSVVNALVGILVRQGRLAVAAPAPVPAWRDPSDPRHAITIEQLMRMTSGLALDETNTGFDPASRMLFTRAGHGGLRGGGRARGAARHALPLQQPEHAASSPA